MIDRAAGEILTAMPCELIRTIGTVHLFVAGPLLRNALAICAAELVGTAS